MKLFYVLGFLFSFSLGGFSQDTLFTKDGKRIEGKVIEVRSAQVKYKSATDDQKQFSLIATSDLLSIHYQNGVYDVFEALLDSSSFRTTFIDGKSIANQPSESKFNAQESEQEYAKKVARQQNIEDGIVVGLRVVGFILRVAFEVALAATGDCHSSSHSGGGNHHSGTYQPRGR